MKKLHGVSCDKNMANFEAFHYSIKLSINPLFLKSVWVCSCKKSCKKFFAHFFLQKHCLKKYMNDIISFCPALGFIPTISFLSAIARAPASMLKPMEKMWQSRTSRSLPGRSSTTSKKSGRKI